MSNDAPDLKWLTSGLLLGLIIASLDQTIVSTAMPSIMEQLDGLSLYSWVFSIYLLTSTVSIPIYGKLADLYGRKRMYLMGLSLFLAGSLLCGLAGSMEQLILYRAVQGVGAGALMPIAFTIVGDLYPLETRGRFMGLFGAVFSLSSILGPAVGGLIAEHLSWSWIFYINLPLGFTAFVIMSKALKERTGGEKKPIDWLGALTFSSAAVSFLLALMLAGNGQGSEIKSVWSAPQVVGLFLIGTILLLLFLWIETKAKEPIIPFHLFKIRAIAAGNAAGFFMSAGMFGAFAYIPLFVQGVVGVSPSVTGYILTPLMLAVVVTTTLGGRLMSKVSYRMILVPSLALMAAGFFLLSRMDAETSFMQIIIYMIITGLGMGAVYPTIGTAAQSAVDFEWRGAATASSQFFRSIGGTIGVSVLGSLLAQRMASGLSGPGIHTGMSASELQRFADPQLLMDAEIRSSLSDEALTTLQSVFTHSLNSVFFAGFLFVCIALIASLWMGKARLIRQ